MSSGQAVHQTGANSDRAIAAEVIGLSKQFGNLHALDNVSIKIEAGSLHALLGENGAGKSTLVKCLMGFYQPTSGQIIINGRECSIPDPRTAQSLGLGMVYQHFTLVPSLTATENLIINRPNCPTIINWQQEKTALSAFLKTMPFDIPLHIPVSRLAAGQKQKLEILKQLYLDSGFLILDEPTSVLTPAEAVDVLSLVQSLCKQKQLTVLMITHKFREVSAFADTVSVLRHGRYTGGGKVDQLSHQAMASMMMGSADKKPLSHRIRSDVPVDSNATTPMLQLDNVKTKTSNGVGTISIDELSVCPGEIVGIAGISGNGQSELMEILTGQRALHDGSIQVDGMPFTPTRKSAREAGVRFIPEEPLVNACASRMSVAENIAFRTFDIDANGKASTWLNTNRLRDYARQLIGDFNVKTSTQDAPISSLSGGNVQRAVLARELSGDVQLLIVSNPCFGLDFGAVADIRKRLEYARSSGTAILLLSEDLDEILELADRILVISGGAINYTCSRESADPETLGHFMAGHSLPTDNANRELSSSKHESNSVGSPAL